MKSKSKFVAKLLGGLLITVALGVSSLTHIQVTHRNTIAPELGPDRHPFAQGTVVDLVVKLNVRNPIVNEGTPEAPTYEPPGSVPNADSTATEPFGPSAIATPGPYAIFLPIVEFHLPIPTPISTKPEPPAVSPMPGWPNGLASQTGSKLGLHVVSNNDTYIMEYVRRVRPRVMKSVDDLGWLSVVKQASPNTVTIGRISGQNESWADQKDPKDAAKLFISNNLTKYHLNPGVDYWEGWNEYVPVTPAHWQWYARFEAARACDMQAIGLHAAVGGFAAGTPEYDQMPYFLPALEAAHLCGGIFTLHEGVEPIFGCGVFSNEANIIPGAPEFPGVTLGYMMLRYRFWYEGYLKPMGLGDLPLVMSELAVGGIVPGSPCNGPGGSGWKGYSAFWVANGTGPSGAQAWANLLAWYDSQIRLDPYVWGTTIFTAGAMNDPRWGSEDLHDVIIPLAYYGTSQQ